jgi:preprotein translocase subunit YajC
LPNLGSLLPFLVLIGAFYFILIRPQRNRQKEMKTLMSRLEPGQQVMTTAGLFASVVSIDGDHVILEIAPGVHVRYMAAAVAKVVDQPAITDPASLDGSHDDLTDGLTDGQ